MTFTPDPEGLSNLMHLGWLPKTEREAEENFETCHVCLARGPLTKEHIPPESAFNDDSRLWEHLVVQGSTSALRRARIRGGFQVSTLCARCNTARCSAYARAYVKFVHHLVDTPALFDHRGTARLVSVSLPLFVAKEIATMILAVEPIHFARHHPDLRNFVLDPRSIIIPPFRILGFLVPQLPETGTIARFHARVASFAPGFQFVGGEISWYPFGFLYATEIGPGYEPHRLTDIGSWFTATGVRSDAKSFFTRLTGVDSLNVAIGGRRRFPQIDYLPSTHLR